MPAVRKRCATWRQERTVPNGLHSLLLEMMALDSDKHAHMLQFVECRLRDAAELHTAGGAD